MKFYGNVGFAVTVDDGYGVWRETITDKKYAGDVMRLTRNKEAGEHINDGLRINTQISILLDPWFQDHLSQIRYVEYMNAKWIVDTVEVQYPRINITLGGLYHGYEPEPDDEPSDGETEETSPDTGGDSGE